MKKWMLLIALIIRFAVMVGVTGIVYAALAILLPFQKNVAIKVCMLIAGYFIGDIIQEEVGKRVEKEANDWVDIIESLNKIVYKKGETYAYTE